MKKIFYALVLPIVALLASPRAAEAQVKLGANPNVLDQSAVLHIENPAAGPYKGVLIPKMTTAQRDAIVTPTIGLYVFNTQTNCFEFWDGAIWNNLCGNALTGGSSTGRLSGSPNSCAPIEVNGTYMTAAPLTGSNNAVVQVTVDTPGTYVIATNTVNGVTFSSTGSFGSTGTHYVALQGVGTPSTDGNFAYTVTYASAGITTACTFNVSVGGNTLVVIPGSLNCNPGAPATGSYSAGVAMTSLNTKTINIGVSTVGSYVFSTNVQNGVAFSATGSFSSTGASLPVVLRASGTPTAGGAFTYTINAYGQQCTFPVTFTAPAIPICTGKVYSSFPAPLINNTPYNGITVTIPYTNGNGSPYPADSQVISGIMLKRPAGNFAVGNGSIVYTTSGTYTGATNGFLVYNVNIGGTICEVTFGDAIRAALSTSTAVYDATPVGEWIKVTGAEYNNLLNTVQGSAKRVQSDTIMAMSNAAASSRGTGATFTEAPIPANPGVTPAQYTQVPASSYIVGFSFRNLNNNPSTGVKIKTSTSQSTGFISTAGGGGMPTVGTSTPNTLYYFVQKRPTGFTTAGLPSHVAIYSNNCQIGAVFAQPATYYLGNGDTGLLTTAQGSISSTSQIQVITTTTRQW